MTSMKLRHAAAILVPLLCTTGTQAQPTFGPWVGVQLAPVPRALQVHLGLNENGVMVRNVYVGSPADTARLERFDVLTEVDGHVVTEGAEGFSRYVQGKKAGEILEITLIHAGQVVTRPLTLAFRPKAWNELEPKYHDEPDLTHSRAFDLRGHILKPGPDGWKWHDLGEVPGLFDVLIDPETGDMTQRRRERQEALEGKHVDENGNVIHLQREKNGPLTVRRYHKSESIDDAEVRVYDNADELRARDPQAAELLDDLVPERSNRTLRPERRLPFGEHRLSPEWNEWRERFRPMLPHPGHPGARPEMDALPEIAPPSYLPPSTTFEVRPDGSIEVEVKRPDAVLRQTFRSEEELREKAPKLYDEYDQLQSRLR